MAWMDCIGNEELSALRLARLKSNPPTHESRRQALARQECMHSLGPDAESSSLQVSTAVPLIKPLTSDIIGYSAILLLASAIKQVFNRREEEGRRVRG